MFAFPLFDPDSVSLQNVFSQVEAAEEEDVVVVFSEPPNLVDFKLRYRMFNI